jgi:hypothetical protein
VFEFDALRGLTIHQLRLGYQLELLASDAGWRDDPLSVVIEAPFSVTGDGETTTADPQDPSSLGMAVKLLHRVVDDVSVDGGTLRMSFTDGTLLVVPPLDRYEAWNISGPGSQLVICTPGGELTNFADDTSTTAQED